MHYAHLLTLLALLALMFAAEATHYCAADICPEGKTHIACRNKGAFAETCPAGARLVNLKPYHGAIVELHNVKRNEIASGRVHGFKPARRMATMKWNAELETLATLNVRQCVIRHDACHNTDDFSQSGQNLAISSFSGPIADSSNAFWIKNSFNGWWNEHKQANMAQIDKYPGHHHHMGPKIGHFTVMVAEKNIRVGCAAARYKQGSTHTFLFACNYATTNIVDTPIYVSGKAASGCQTGRDSKFTGLCSKREKYANL